MRIRFSLERSESASAPWSQIYVASSPAPPSALGFVGKSGECLCWVCEGKAVEIWEWSDRVPLNPADLQCTDFVAGWKLVHREASPVPSADELAHYYAQ